NEGATDWMAANWPGPEARVASRRTAARFMLGAICLSSSSHFAPRLYSYAMNVATRPRQTIDEAGADWIRDDREHNGHGSAHLEQRRHACIATRQDNIRRDRDQFRSMAANAVGVGGGPAGVELHVATNRPARLLQPLRKRRDAGLHYGIIRGERHKHANAPHPARLLPARRERPRSRCAAEQRDELAPSQVEHGLSSPCIGWTLGEPFFALRTSSRPVASSTCDHCRSHNSDARKPWRYPIRIIVASRWP